jgi:formate dehydrogenase subunit gamma
MDTGTHAAAASPRADWTSTVDEALKRYEGVAGALLPVLHAVQDELGFIPPESQAKIALGLNLSQAEVHGVVTFYHDFRSSPPGRHLMMVCRAEACQAMGSDALVEQLKARTGADVGSTTADGSLTLQPVYCLGNCACSPAVMIDGRLEGRVTAAKLDRLLAMAKATS